MARATRRDPRLDAIGQRIGDAIVAELDAAGLPIDRVIYGPLLGASGPIIAALDREALTRHTTADQGREEERIAWAAGAAAASWEDLHALWGLSTSEMRAARALGFLQPVEVPYDLREPFSTPHYYRVTVLTDEQRSQIAAATLISRTDAAARLGVTPAVFDRLRTQHGLTPADRARTRAGFMMLLFRQTDVDRLSSTLAMTSRP